MNTRKRAFYLALMLSCAFLIGSTVVWADCHGQKEESSMKKEGDCHPGDCGKKDDENSMPCPKDMFFDKMKMIMVHKETLELTDDQMAAFKKLKVETKKNLILKESEIEVNDVDLKAQIWESDWQADDLNKLIDKKFDLMKEEAKILVTGFSTLKSILTKDQEKLLHEKFMESPHKSKAMMCPISESKPVEKNAVEKKSFDSMTDMDHHSSAIQETKESKDPEEKKHPTDIPDSIKAEFEKQNKKNMGLQEDL